MADPIPNTATSTPLETPNPEYKSSTKQVVFTICASIALPLTAFAIVILLCLLAMDVMHIPYLSAFAKFLFMILAPFVPLFFPVFLGIFLKVCQHKTWPQKKVWMFITGSWVFQHLQRAVTDAIALNHGGDMCGLSECKEKWAEWAMVAVVVLCQMRGWKWDVGYVDMWIEGLIAQDAKATAMKKAKEEGAQDVDLEKGDKFEGLVYTDAKEEKRELKARDEMVIRAGEVLVVVDDQEA